MATSGFKDVQVTSWDTLRFKWWEIVQSISGNYTTVGWELQLIAGSSGYISSSASKSWNVTVNGSYYEGTNTVGISNNTTKVLASGQTVVYHNDDGAKTFSYSFNQYFGITFSGSKINTVSGSGTGSLTSIPRKANFTNNGVSNFDDDTNPVIYFNHPAGSALELQACIKCGDTFIAGWRKIDNTKNSYTFDISEIRANIWSKSIAMVSDTIDVTFGLATWVGSDFDYSYSTSVKCTVKDCEPTLEPTVVDTGGVSTSLTGNNTSNSDTLIKYYNYVTATFNSSAKKNASIVYRSVRCGNENRNPSGDYAIFENAEDKTFIFTIRDSRGKTVEKEVKFNTLIPYIKLTCNTTVDKDLQSNNTANININITGDYYEGSFGKVNNDLVVEYRYKSNTTEFQDEWEPAEISISDGKYSATASITGLDYRGTYTIQTRAKDKVFTGYVTAKDEVVKIIPVFDWGENDFNFNVPVTIQGQTVCTAEPINNRIARAYTQENHIVYTGTDLYIKLFRENSPTDLYNQDIATFNDNGLITINKDMIALVNIHIVGQSISTDNRTWISFWNYKTNWKVAECIQYGNYTTSQITTVLKLSKDDVFGIRTHEPITVNASGLIGSYIEIIEL